MRQVRKFYGLDKLRMRSLFLTFGVLKSLHDEVKGLFGSLDDKLLEKIFEELVDLVCLEVLLNLVHVVVLLKFVHLLNYK